MLTNTLWPKTTFPEGFFLIISRVLFEDREQDHSAWAATASPETRDPIVESHSIAELCCRSWWRSANRSVRPNWRPPRPALRGKKGLQKTLAQEAASEKSQILIVSPLRRTPWTLKPWRSRSDCPGASCRGGCPDVQDAPLGPPAYDSDEADPFPLPQPPQPLESRARYAGRRDKQLTVELDSADVRSRPPWHTTTNPDCGAGFCPRDPEPAPRAPSGR